ncbi:MAG: hypothetical protein LUH10_07660 [Tannerellaceae bacterium]|nr:hypothetical protein [Tannerellaceae bacterium]
MISTSTLELLPGKQTLQKLCKSISLLDAIFSPEWEYRYYSYNRKWSDKEEVFEMKNGSGDQMLILFREEGCVINGFTIGGKVQQKEILTHSLPGYFNDFIFGEPVNTIGTTFCIWSTGSGEWQTGADSSSDDLSGTLLSIFDGKPETYCQWANDYYFEGDYPDGEIDLKTVSQLYEGTTLTKEMVLALNTDFEDWVQLEEDIENMGYPFNFETPKQDTKQSIRKKRLQDYNRKSWW